MKGNHKSNINLLLAMPRQAGGLTIFTAIFVLVLMTLMLFYATRVGLFEQRVSGNDARQKLAFQVAEAGLDYAVEYMLAVNLRILSKSTEATPDGNGGFHPGWLSDGNVLWVDCPASPGDDHPCGGEIDAGGTGSLYYDDPDTAGYDSLPLDANLLANLPPNTAVRVTAVICPRSLGAVGCLGSDEIPEPGETSLEPVKFTVSLLSYGYSDCNDDNANGSIDIPGECRGNASVTVPFGAVRNFRGTPDVPLVSKNSLPATGTAEVVPNPNAGGVGVPVSIWANKNIAECAPLDSSGDPSFTIAVEGNFTTCEMQEWYNTDSRPADGKCSFGPGSCSCEINEGETISYRSGNDEVIGIDVVSDAAFPCDLFAFYFGVNRNDYQSVKADATVIDDCGILTTESAGFYWFSGDTCTISNHVGTINNPVILLSAAETKTVMGGNLELFGILYISDVEDETGDAAYFKPGGGATVYGAVIVEVLFPESNLAGTFKVIYNEGAILNAGGLGSLGGLAGGWRDFGMPRIEWAE